MTRKVGSRVLAVGLGMVFQAMFATNAMAHFVNLEATARCGDGAFALIDYHAFSWDQQTIAGSNPDIDIVLNNVFAEDDAFKLQTDNEFFGTLQATGTSAVLMAIAQGTWGDGAGGLQSTSITVTLPTNCGTAALGRFTGGGKQFSVAGVKVTKGFTIHCDLLLSNNLEINWANGGQHQFHMQEHAETVACTDDPLIEQEPPPSPVDTIIGRGTGRYDGSAANTYTVEFILIDAGEPGSNDQAGFRIYETANPANVVLNTGLNTIVGGNVQTHFDQPHK